jgi:hypothetical protein
VPTKANNPRFLSDKPPNNMVAEKIEKIFHA